MTGGPAAVQVEAVIVTFPSWCSLLPARYVLYVTDRSLTDPGRCRSTRSDFLYNLLRKKFLFIPYFTHGRVQWHWWVEIERCIRTSNWTYLMWRPFVLTMLWFLFIFSIQNASLLFSLKKQPKGHFYAFIPAINVLSPPPLLVTGCSSGFVHWAETDEGLIKSLTIRFYQSYLWLTGSIHE